MHRLAILLAALWWGGITALSFVAVPTLFARLESPAVAGPVAAHLFSLQCWTSLVLGVVLMLLLRRQRVRWGADASLVAVERLRALLVTTVVVVLAVLLAMLQEFAVAPQIVTARATGGHLPLWHGLGSVMVLGQWCCTGTVLWRLAGAQRAA